MILRTERPAHKTLKDSETVVGMNARTNREDLQSLRDLAEENGIEIGVELLIKRRDKITRVKVMEANFSKGSRIVLKRLNEKGREMDGEPEIGLTALIESVNKVKMDKIKAIVERQKGKK
jgi:hypothetical protein